MGTLSENIQSADWKSEKHVPVIDCPDQVASGEFFTVSLTLGKEIAHPNTTEHHIRWMSLYFHPEGAKSPSHVATFELAAHGEAVAGPNEGPVYTGHSTTTSLKVTQSGTLYAVAYCNIHGVWESTKDITVG